MAISRRMVLGSLIAAISSLIGYFWLSEPASANFRVSNTTAKYHTANVEVIYKTETILEQQIGLEPESEKTFTGLLEEEGAYAISVETASGLSNSRSVTVNLPSTYAAEATIEKQKISIYLIQ